MRLTILPIAVGGVLLGSALVAAQMGGLRTRKSRAKAPAARQAPIRVSPTPKDPYARQNVPMRKVVTKFGTEWTSALRPIDADLFAAARKGDAPKVRQLIAAGADANVAESGGGNPLYALGGTPGRKLAVARVLVSAGADVRYRSRGDGRTPIMAAIEKGDNPALVRYFASKGASVNAATKDGATALHLAVASGRRNVVRELLRRGASVSARSLGWAPPTGFRGEALAEIEEFERHMAEPGYRGAGQTPIFWLALRWDEPIYRMLRAKGASLRDRDAMGWTPLHVAALSVKPKAVERLVALGIDPNAASKAGYRPLHLAARIALNEASEPVLRTLLRLGADPTSTEARGRTPLAILREDAEWMLRKTVTHPGLGGRVKAEEIAKRANARIRLLDPMAEPVVVPSPPRDASGFRYPDLEFGDLRVERSVREENGRAVLELRFPAPEEAATLRLTKVRLEGYAPLTSLPLVLRLVPGKEETVHIEFPLAAAKGGAVAASYELPGRSGSFSEGPARP